MQLADELPVGVAVAHQGPTQRPLSLQQGTVVGHIGQQLGKQRALRAEVAGRQLPIAALAKTEMLTDSPSTYLRKREAGGKSRQPAYEVALASGRVFKSGDAVSYYVVGTKKNLPVHANARLASEFDPARRDENVAYYLAKLDALIKKLDARVPETPGTDDDQPTLF